MQRRKVIFTGVGFLGAIANLENAEAKIMGWRLLNQNEIGFLSFSDVT